MEYHLEIQSFEENNNKDENLKVKGKRELSVLNYFL